MESLSKKSATKWLLSSAIASTLIFTLAGCSNTEEENPKLEKTSDASVTEPTDYVPASADGPAQNVPEPRLPAVATENTEEGAQAALEYFWEAAQYVRLTGETKPLAQISSKDCDFCNAFIKDWETTYKEGYWAVPEGEVALSVADSWIGEDEKTGAHSADVLFSVSEPLVVVYDADGQQLESANIDPKEDTEWFALLIFDATSQRWNVDWIGLEELVSWED